MKCKNIKWLLTAPIMILLCGCDTDAVLPPESAGLGYFPLLVGNRWKYAMENNPNFQWEYEVVGTKQIGLIDYFVLERRINENAYVEQVYFRVGPAGKIYTFWQGQDVLYIDFEKQQGRQWHSYGEYVGIMNKRNIQKDVPAGKFDNCVEIFFNIPQMVDDEIWETYAPGIGLVEIGSAWFYGIKLQSAHVNGVDYP